MNTHLTAPVMPSRAINNPPGIRLANVPAPHTPSCRNRSADSHGVRRSCAVEGVRGLAGVFEVERFVDEPQHPVLAKCLNHLPCFRVHRVEDGAGRDIPRPPPYAGPRPPAPPITFLPVRDGGSCACTVQTSCPVTASMAKSLVPELKYITSLTTSGVCWAMYGAGDLE